MTTSGPRAGLGAAREHAPDREEQALRAGIERFQQIADTIDLVLWAHELEAGSRISYVSPAFERIWGRSAEALYDDPGLWLSAIHDDDRPRVAEAFAHRVGDPAANDFRIEYRIVRPDGTLRWISDVGRTWSDERRGVYRLTGAAEDITVRKLAEQRVRESEQQFKAMVEGLPQLVWTCRPDGSCDFLSPQWIEFSGMPDTPETLLRWVEHMHPADAQRAQAEWWRSVRDETDFVCQYRLRRRDGVYRWFKARALPLRGEDHRLQRWFGTCTDIENLKQAETALREERDRLDRIARTAPSILHTFRRAADGSVSFPYGSERIAELFDVPVEEVRRDGAAVRRRMDRASGEHLREMMDISARTMQPWLVQFRIDTPRRGAVWIEGHSMPVAEEDGSINWHGSLTDITQRKLSEQALFDSQRQLRSLFDHLGDGLIMLTPQGRLLQWNPVALRLHGFVGDEDLSSVDNAVFDHFELYTLDGTFVPTSDWPLARILRGETLRDAEHRVHHRVQGWERVLAYSGALVYGASGEPILSIMQLRDTTEQRRKDDELRQLTLRLEDRVRERTIELESAISELEAFSYSVSHDLRAPLRAMDGFSQLLMRDHAPRLDGNGQRYLGIIHESSRKMGRLIEDLLAFARLSRQPLRKRPVATGVLVDEVIHQLQPMQQGRDVEWRIGELPGCDGDLPMLRQVWINLLSNALKYSRPREHTVIEIGAHGEAAHPAYYVRDNGMGFDMAHVHKLFGVFQRLHRDEDFEGTGVGLALVQRIVLRHGGEIRAEGRPGQGATFTFSLGGAR